MYKTIQNHKHIFQVKSLEAKKKSLKVWTTDYRRKEII